MDSLNNYITERIRIDNVKTIDFTKLNKFEGKFEINGIIISSLGEGHINLMGDVDWYYCQYQDKLIFFSPMCIYMPFITVSDISQYFGKNYAMWSVAWLGNGTTPNQFTSLMDRSSQIIFNDKNVDKFKKIYTSKDVDILVNKWYSTL
jgi:hypothetical protein